MTKKEIFTIQGYVNSDAQSCSYDDCTIVMTTIGKCGLAYPMTKSEFEDTDLPRPEIGDKFERTITIVPLEPFKPLWWNGRHAG